MKAVKIAYHQSHHLFVIIILLSIASSIRGQRITVKTSDLTESDLESKERTAELFQDWMEKHRKVYSNTKEMLIRYENFKVSIKYVIEENMKRKRPTDQVLGLTGFSDMTHEEFKQKYASGIKGPPPSTKNHKSDISINTPSCNPPPYWNWTAEGAVTHVKDQSYCGSCWAFSSTGALEGMNKIVTGKLVNVSEQQLVDCVEVNFGCGGGWMHQAFIWVKDNKGIVSEEDYPYVAKEQECDTSKVDNVMTIDGYEQVEATDSALQCAVLQQPISACVDASSYDFMYYTGGVYDGNCTESITHAVLIVGYGTKEGVDYWIVKNSWDTWWGDNGYIYIIRDPNLPKGKCGINQWNYYPIKNKPEDLKEEL